MFGSDRSQSASARDFKEIARLLRDLESRLAHLGTSVPSDARDASRAVPDMISQVFADLAERAREGARNVGDEATRVGSDTLKKIEDQVERQPLVTLAVAAGIGFLLGVLNRR